MRSILYVRITDNNPYNWEEWPICQLVVEDEVVIDHKMIHNGIYSWSGQPSVGWRLDRLAHWARQRGAHHDIALKPEGPWTPYCRGIRAIRALVTQGTVFREQGIAQHGNLRKVISKSHARWLIESFAHELTSCEQRAAYMLGLYILNGLTYREIGDLAGLSGERIRQIVCKGRRALCRRAILKPLNVNRSLALPLVSEALELLAAQRPGSAEPERTLHVA